MPPKAFVGRYISVYFNTREEKTFWEEIAKEHGTTLSKLVFEGLETLREKTESNPRPDLLKENESLKAKITKTEREIRMQANLIEKYESELYRARYARPLQSQSRLSPIILHAPQGSICMPASLL